MLVLSHYIEPDYAMDLLAETAEGVGYLLKDRISAGHELADAARRVARGGSALDPGAPAPSAAGAVRTGWPTCRPASARCSG